MINALIIEDEELAASRLKRLIKENFDDIHILATHDSIDATVVYLNENPKPDLLFLDIQLADGLSFEIFNRIKVQSPVIFTTAFDEYAIKAFQVNSIAYLLKPIKLDELKESIAKFREIKQYFSEEELNLKISNLFHQYSKQSSEHKSRFLINKGEHLISVKADEIAYFYTEDKAVFLIDNNGNRHIINQSLETLEAKLNPRQFFRISRQYLISITSVKKISNYFNYKLKLNLQPETDKLIVVSRAKAVEFKKWLDD